MGLRGWGTEALLDGSFKRLRYTGLPNRMPVGIQVEPGIVQLDFSEKIDPDSIDVADFKVERWRYAYTSRYGSPELSVENPEKEGHDPVTVSGVRLSEDGRSVLVEIPDLKPVMQQSIEYRVRFADGGIGENTVYHTIHRVVGNEVPGPDLYGIVDSDDAEPEVVDEDPLQGAAAEFAAGLEVFQNTCASCHQIGGGGAAPAFSDSEWAAGSKDALIRIVLQGKTGDRGVMTPFGWLSDEDLASVLSYIRVRWHEENPVTEEEIRAVRTATEGRTKFWTAEELKQFRESE